VHHDAPGPAELFLEACQGFLATNGSSNASSPQPTDCSLIYYHTRYNLEMHISWLLLSERSKRCAYFLANKVTNHCIFTDEKFMQGLEDSSSRPPPVHSEHWAEPPRPSLTAFSIFRGFGIH
jgi:hypothetical protein